MQGVVFEAPSSRHAAILVLYDHDGKTPTRRDFKAVDDGRRAYERLAAYTAACAAKHRAPPNADVMFLYVRAPGRSDVWILEQAAGGGVAAVALAHWVDLRVRAPFEAGAARYLSPVSTLT